MGSPHSMGQAQSLDGVITDGAGIGKHSVPAITMTLSTITDAAQYHWKPGFNGRLIDNRFVTHTPATTAAKLSTLTPSIGGVNVTGGTIALTTVSCNTRNKETAGAAITGANTFTENDTITWTASATTAFVEGSGVLQAEVYNDDLRRAVGLGLMGLQAV